MSCLELRDISKAFDGIRAVDDVSLGFEAGAITGLIGPNGAGKTTIFNLISGFVQPDSGDILLQGQSISELPAWKIARLGLGRLFQDVRAFRHMSAIENVLVGFRQQIGETPFMSLIARSRYVRESRLHRNRAVELLAFVGLEAESENSAETLSYGQQKLLSIARLLASDPAVLLLDEPTSGVSPKMAEKLIDLMKKLASSGKTVAVIEHNMSVVMEVADWTYFLNEGQVTFFGPPDDVLGNPEVRKAYIGV